MAAPREAHPAGPGAPAAAMAPAAPAAAAASPGAPPATAAAAAAASAASPAAAPAAPATSAASATSAPRGAPAGAVGAAGAAGTAAAARSGPSPISRSEGGAPAAAPDDEGEEELDALRGARRGLDELGDVSLLLNATADPDSSVLGGAHGGAPGSARSRGRDKWALAPGEVPGTAARAASPFAASSRSPKPRTVLDSLDWTRRPEVHHPVGWWGDKYVIYPNNAGVIMWDVFILFLLLIQMWTIPYEVGAYGGRIWEIAGAWGLAGHLILTLIFLADTIMSFFRAVRDAQGRLLWRLEEIAWYYATGWFFVDLLSCIPAYSIAYAANPPRGSTGYHVLELLQVLRLLRLLRINRTLLASPWIVKIWLRTSHRTAQLGSIFVTCIYFMHMMACAWCFTFQLEDGDTWVHKYLAMYQTQLDPLNNGMDLYVLALYWATTTMVSVGYGDVVPMTRPEYWVCTICVMTSAGLWAWVVAALVDVVGDMSRETNELRAKLAVLNRANAPPELDDPNDRRAWISLMDESRLFLHTEFLRSHDTDRLREVLPDLSQGLQARILLAQSRAHLLRVPYMAQARANTIIFLTSSMVRRDFSVGETVVHDPTLARAEGGIVAERHLYYLVFGTMLSMQGPRVASLSQSRRSRNVVEVAPFIVAGELVHDTDGTLSGKDGARFWSESKMRVLTKGDFWDADNFALASSSSLYRPGRLKALTYCETLALPRTKFVEALKMDPDLLRAVRWRRLKVGLRAWAREVLRRKQAMARSARSAARASAAARAAKASRNAGAASSRVAPAEA